MAIHCIHCGTELPDIAQFCLACGKPPKGETAAAPTVSASTPETYPAYLNAPTVRSDGPSTPDPLTPPPSPMASYYSTESLYAPGSAGTPFGPSPAQRKSRRGLWIALAIIAVVLVAGGGGLAYYFANQSTPTKTLQAACDAIESGDYKALHNLYTTHLQFRGPAASPFFIGSDKDYKGGVASCTVSGVNEQGASASGTISFKFGDGNMETHNIQLVDENGTWKISGIDAGS